MRQARLTALALAIAALNVAYWALVVTRGERRFRAWVMGKFDVVIATGSRGHWRASGASSRPRLLAIELLQLAYFMAAFLVWAMLLGLGIALLGLLDP